MAEPGHIRVALLGAGHQGLKYILTLPLVQEYFRVHGHPVDLEAVCDEAEAPKQQLALLLDSLGIFDPSIFHTNLAEFLQLGTAPRSGSAGSVVLVCDATRSSDHFKHLRHVAAVRQAGSANIYYLGEKPVVLDSNTLHELRNANWGPFYFCDFIELQSLPFLAVSAWLKEHGDFVMKKMRFWRYGYSGLKRLFLTGQRGGVQGGALLDKGVHDVALSIGFLDRPGAIKKWEITEDPQVSALIPYTWADMEAARVAFLDTLGRHIDCPRKEEQTTAGSLVSEVADADFKLQVRWYLDSDESVDAEYRCSWRGVSDADIAALEQELASMDIRRAQWLGDIGHHEGRPWGAPTKNGFPEQEFRLCIVDGSLGATAVKLVCNFLGYRTLGLREAWAYEYRNGEKTLLRPQASPLFGQYALPRILVSCLQEIVGRVDPAIGQARELLGRDAIVLVHEVLLEARRLWLDRLAQGFDPGVVASTSAKVFREAMARGAS